MKQSDSENRFLERNAPASFSSANLPMRLLSTPPDKFKGLNGRSFAFYGKSSLAYARNNTKPCTIVCALAGPARRSDAKAAAVTDGAKDSPALNPLLAFSEAGFFKHVAVCMMTRRPTSRHDVSLIRRPLKLYIVYCIFYIDGRKSHRSADI